MIRRLTTEGDIRGVHFCTLNLEMSVQRILESLQWTKHTPHIQNQLIAVSTLIYMSIQWPKAHRWAKETPGTIIHAPPPESDLIVTPITATDTATRSFVGPPAVDNDVLGEQSKAASWDDFPNGRFGDFSSPAFGIQGPWGGPSISVCLLCFGLELVLAIYTTSQGTGAFSEWGRPTTIDDLNRIFVRYLHSDLSATPFSPTPLSPESLLILPHLERLTNHGWWTVGSQPAIDGASSSDDVVGWGPPGGYVYQKAFVEFFSEKSDVERIQCKIETEGKGWAHYFAGNYKVSAFPRVYPLFLFFLRLESRIIY